MAAFFKGQMDYIFFFYGLAFLIMAAACFTMREKERRLPWFYLGIFGVIHGLNEWLDMIAVTLGDNPAFSAFRICVMIASFIFLVEFGRSGLITIKEKGPGRWIYIPLLLLAALGESKGWAGLNAASRYSLGLPGGILAATALFLASRGLTDSMRRSLLSGAVGMGLYAFATGAIVPKAPFFPANLINHSSFMETLGFPVQLARGIFATWIAASIWFYSEASFGEGIEAKYKELRRRFARWMTLTMTAILVFGWVVTELIGRDRDVAIIRLISINGVCVLSVIIIAFFIAWQRDKESDLKIEALSLRDPLTGLANRRMMEIMIERYFLEAKRYERDLSVIMADIDHFKRYNDTYGHQAGDRLLVDAAGLLQKGVRESDIVARYGGEEFLVILPETGVTEACMVAEKVRKAFEEMGKVTVSLGVSSFHAGVEDKERLLKEADDALYRAKEGGRNRVGLSFSTSEGGFILMQRR